MFGDWRSRAVGRLELAAILMIAGAIAAVVALLLLYEARPAPRTDPAKEAAHQQINQIYEEELVKAQAAALANETARQAELNAADEFINIMGNVTSTPVDELPLEAEALPTEPLAQFAPVPRGAPNPPDKPAVATGPVRSKDGHTVDVEALVNSVRAAGARRERSE